MKKREETLRFGIMNQTPAISVENLSVRFDDKPVLDNLCFDLFPGERIGLNGPSGAGKSTVLRSILGFVIPEQGRVRIEGQTLDSQSVWRLRARLAYVSQEPDLGDGTARQAIERPFAYRANRSLRNNLSRAPELMERFLLPPDLLEKEAARLSGGEKQRLALVMAILLDRRIFLLDEAASALDRASRETVRAFFEESPGVAILSVFHENSPCAVDRTIDLPKLVDGREPCR